jgi:uncharacterized Ntn-hydrolase superfamily protein
MDFGPLWDVGRMAGAGLIAGLFAAYMGSRDHRFKKWWELRVAAYQSAIDALSDMAYAYEVRYLAEIEGRELSKERKDELGALTVQAFTRVRKAADAGAFLFSAEANAALDLVRKEWDTDHMTYQEHLDAMQFASRQCLTRIVALSKEDLKLQRHLFIWN